MKIPIYKVDAFTNCLFSGNPAAVCLLEKWLPDGIMQQIAEENNLSETAFVVKEKDHYRIRWFTPMMEVELCGHATLASAYVLFFIEKVNEKMLVFDSLGGKLSVRNDDPFLILDFPADPVKSAQPTEDLLQALDIRPLEVFKGKFDYLALFDNQKDIEQLKPDMRLLGKVKCRGLIVTSQGDGFDFVSRFFAPRAGVPEDAVTGSAHATLAPFWADRLGKDDLIARQLSKRGGTLKCRYQGDRVEIAGQARLFLSGHIEID